VSDRPAPRPRAPRKARADQLLVDRGLAPSRARAQAAILAGQVFSGDARVDKPGDRLDQGAPLHVVARSRFVSRGGDKLDRALAALGGFDDLTGRVALDVGASTGGFTDCLLQRGARLVYAVDVGRAQLHERLRADPRVAARERTNARDLAAADFSETIGLAVVDASFIGIDKLVPALARVLPAGGELVALVKPQFEAGRAEVARGRGVIRDEAVRERAIEGARAAIVAGGFVVVGEVDSEVAGPKGNVERFIHARRA
jgi:23S rRNA (cytidine1920-2'-O)/16S rRNA (cytidine1409-2'-O)-methyltransferase